MPESSEPMLGARSTENPVWEAVKAQPGKGICPEVFDHVRLWPPSDGAVQGTREASLAVA